MIAGTEGCYANCGCFAGAGASPLQCPALADSCLALGAAACRAAIAMVGEAVAAGRLAEAAEGEAAAAARAKGAAAAAGGFRAAADGARVIYAQTDSLFVLFPK